MTKMAAILIYGKNPSKIFFSGAGGPISKKLGVKHLWFKYYNVYINHDPVMTLTQFRARSTCVDHAFKWGKLLKCPLKGKASRKLANGQNIHYSEKKEENGPRASSAPALGLNTILFKHVYWCMQQISSERLQDHWSSCLAHLSRRPTGELTVYPCSVVGRPQFQRSPLKLLGQSKLMRSILRKGERKFIEMVMVK